MQKSMVCKISQHGTRPKIRVRDEKLFSYFSNKTYIVGTQKNRLTEMVLLSTLDTTHTILC